MKTLVLAAGLGTRIRSMFGDIPKPMVEVAGRKVLEQNIRSLVAAGVTEIVINVHFLPEVIKEYFGNGERHGARIEYLFEPELSGSAGAAKKMEEIFKEEFLLVYGDSLYHLDFKNIINASFPKNSPALVVMFDKKKNPYTGSAGGLMEVGPDNRLVRFLEGQRRPDSFVNAGIYKLRPEIFSHIPKNTFYDFGKDLFPSLLAKDIHIATHAILPHEGVFGVDTPEYFAQATEFFKQNHFLL